MTTPGSGATPPAAPLPVPHLLAISDRRSLPGGEGLQGWLRAIAEAWSTRTVAAAGASATRLRLAVQIREKDLPDADLLALLRLARKLLPGEIAVLVNGRFELTLEAAVEGVHLPSTGPSVTEARRAATEGGRALLVGRSTHSAEEVSAARDEGADYVTFGPVYPTPGKAGYGPPPGLPGLRRAAGLGLPVLALGGVDAARLQEVAAAGAHGAAAIRAFRDTAATAAMLETGTRHLHRV